MSRKRRFTGYAKASKPRRVPGEMNNTEREYSEQLDALKGAGTVVYWWYERVTLKLGSDLRYTPDFLVLFADGTLELHEVKGALIRDDAFAKLKVAADLFPFRFVMQQKLAKKHGGGWKRVEIASDTWQPVTATEAA